MTDNETIRQACIAYNGVLFNQPEDERNQHEAMRAALAVVRQHEGERVVCIGEETVRELRMGRSVDLGQGITAIPASGFAAPLPPPPEAAE